MNSECFHKILFEIWHLINHSSKKLLYMFVHILSKYLLAFWKYFCFLVSRLFLKEKRKKLNYRRCLSLITFALVRQRDVNLYVMH